MPSGPNAIEEYALAVSMEKEAWDAIRDRLPGSASFSPDLWQRWRSAVDDADRAASRAKECISLPAAKTAGAAGPRFPGTGWPKAIQLPPILSRLQGLRR